MTDSSMQLAVPIETIASSIVVIRGQKVILDSDLARLYGTSTKRLNEQVRRNIDRFPADFCFQLSSDEAESLRSQNATSKTGRGGRRYQPFVFTEHGAVMAASVLNTPRAVEVSVYVVRAFVRLRQVLATHADLAYRLDELEQRLEARLDLHDEQIAALMDAIRQLMTPLETDQRQIGFKTMGNED